MNAFAKLFLIFLFTLVSSQKISANECFDFNKKHPSIADVHAVSALLCSVQSNNLQERSPYDGNNGANYFHRWKVEKLENNEGLYVSGQCSNQYNFTTKQTSTGELFEIYFWRSDFEVENPRIHGKLGRKTIVLNYQDTAYSDPMCVHRDDGIVRIRDLESVKIGVGIFEILLSQRSNQTLYRADKNIWAKPSEGLSLIKLNYRIPQFQGRQLRAMINGVEGEKHLVIKLGQYLFQSTGDYNWDDRKDVGNHLFYYQRDGVMNGCSYLISKSELAEPRLAKVQDCIELQRRIKLL
jgi:hypothetical protein